MKKSKIFLIILAVIIALISVLVWWQFGNIKSAYYWFKYDKENISELIDKQNDDVDKILKDRQDLNVRQSTEAEQKLHQEELINDDEFIDVLTGKTDVPEMFGQDIGLDESKNFVDSNGNPISKEELQEAKKDTDTQSSQADDKQKASECVARMYVLKSNFEGRLGSLFNEAKAHYLTYPYEERVKKKGEILKDFYLKAVALEKECDSNVDKVLNELDAILTRTGEDKSIITKIRESYDNEKSLKKAYYLNLYNSKS